MGFDDLLKAFDRLAAALICLFTMLIPQQILLLRSSRGLKRVRRTSSRLAAEHQRPPQAPDESHKGRPAA